MKPNEKDSIEIDKITKLLHESSLTEKTISVILNTVYYMGANAGMDMANKIIE